MKLTSNWIVQALLVAVTITPSLGFKHVLPRDINSKPMQVIAGVKVIDTPLVRAAQAYAQSVSPPVLFNHIMRTWLFGALVISHNTSLLQTVDLEVHAVGSMLHDLGLILDATWISPDKRFEVDSALATVSFVEAQIEKEGKAEPKWDANRFQLLFDAVLLSSEYRFALYKQDTVKVLVMGVLIDIQKVEFGLTGAEYAAVEQAFPPLEFKAGVNATLVKLCAQKPNTTFDSWQQAFGDEFVPGYKPSGRYIDIFGH